MKNPSNAELQLRRELVAEEDNLSALVNETNYAIGKVARNGYAELHKLPAQSGPARSYVAIEGYSPLLRMLHLRSRTHTHIRNNAMPDSPVLVPGNSVYTVAATSTIAHHSPYMPCSRAGKWAHVAVQLHNPVQPRYIDPIFRVNVQGSASYNNDYKDTLPHRSIGNPRSRAYRTSDTK